MSVNFFSSDWKNEIQILFKRESSFPDSFCPKSILQSSTRIFSQMFGIFYPYGDFFQNSLLHFVKLLLTNAGTNQEVTMTDDDEDGNGLKYGQTFQV